MSAVCATGALTSDSSPSVWVPYTLWAVFLWYCASVHLLITVCFVTRRGMWLIGKSPRTGQVPWWSLLVWFPFHLPTHLYTAVHTAMSKRAGVPVASEVVPGWWLGGRYGAELGRTYAAVVDLTVEFSEGCRDRTAEYLLLACWDGVPPDPAGLEDAAQLCARCRHRGDVMVHCAHGRGRSTCVILACLVRAGVFSNWREAFEKIKPMRKGIKLNSKMRHALDEWQKRYP
ncbi:hypothetical protein AB1Y20_017956 [Prymnesium parvum]|uniref:Tyrosine specific protein phosphatases domain-containing protein n=1 Tax=Prymnesium parvum TaxID=97485 RepID=A0AB34JMQ2_PRYPA